MGGLASNYHIPLSAAAAMEHGMHLFRCGALIASMLLMASRRAGKKKGKFDYTERDPGDIREREAIFFPFKLDVVSGSTWEFSHFLSAV